jgi:hypothetical protein
MNQGRSVFRVSLAVWTCTAPLLFSQPEDRAPVCAKCHAKETAAYLKSPMGNSIAPPTPLAAGRVARKASKIEMSIEEREGRMIHSLTENGLSAEYPIAYQIGAGKVGYTYIVRIGEYLFESPASWYRQHGWDLSPGYQRMPAVDFDRLIDSVCLFCHADNGKFLASDGRRFSGVKLEPIGCDRCHGPGEEHVRQPSAKNIVNPSKLARRARDSICEQCHLEGETRLLNPGKTWQDYHPGEELERTAVTYLFTENNQQVKAVAQVEQLALSRCVRESGGKLWCASCHKPHAASKAAHAGVTECISCHMPRLTSGDIPHTLPPITAFFAGLHPFQAGRMLERRSPPGRSLRRSFARATWRWLPWWWAERAGCHRCALRASVCSMRCLSANKKTIRRCCRAWFPSD